MKRWPTKPLGELCDVRIGRTPRRDESRFWGGDAVWVTIRELNGGEVSSSKEMISEAAVQECMPEPVPIGTLLFSFKLSIGKMAVAGCPLYTNEAIAALPIRDPTKLSRDFLRYALLAESHEGTANTAVLGKVLNKEKVQQLSIALPPLAEQEKIVRLLDEADELRKLRAQADRCTADLIPSLFHDMFGDVDSNSKKWPMIRFAEIGEARLGKMLDAKQQTGRHKRFYLRNANVQWNRLDLDDLLEMDFSEADREEFRLRPGDLLICEGGEVGRAAIWRDELPECYFQKALHRVRLHPSRATPEFALHLLQAIATANGFRDYVGSATIPHLTGIKLASIRIPLPPLTLQKEFAAHVSEIHALQAKQATSRNRLEDLFQSMLHRAFNGAL